jgi:predicted nuclease with TOPRIM domain
MIGSFTFFVFGQASEIAGADGQPDVIRVIGWIAIVVAALTHTTMNVYNMIRGKNYEQIKEAMNNYKELADSRSAQLTEVRAELFRLQHDKERLEIENERLAEKVLRL